MGEKMERFTPGEWYATTRLGSWDWLVAIEGTNLEVCQCFHDGTEMNETGEANARLIAAAPDLLEACKAHEEWERKEKEGPQYPAGVSRDNGGEHIWRAWWDEQLALCSKAESLTRAAISKATTQERDRS